MVVGIVVAPFGVISEERFEWPGKVELRFELAGQVTDERISDSDESYRSECRQSLEVICKTFEAARYPLGVRPACVDDGRSSD